MPRSKNEGRRAVATRSYFVRRARTSFTASILRHHSLSVSARATIAGAAPIALRVPHSGLVLALATKR